MSDIASSMLSSSGVSNKKCVSSSLTAAQCKHHGVGGHSIQDAKQCKKAIRLTRNHTTPQFELHSPQPSVSTMVLVGMRRASLS
jgi:hypothetical protein